MPKEMVCQLLDDVCADRTDGSQALWKFDEVNQEVPAEQGVRFLPWDNTEISLDRLPGTLCLGSIMMQRRGHWSS